MINNSEAINDKINIQDNHKAGIFFMITAAICFALMGSMVKKVGHLPLMEIIFFRNIAPMLIVPIMIKKANVSFLGNNKSVLWFRSIIETMVMMSGYYTLTVMSLTDAVAIFNLSPFFTFFLAGIFLKEKLSLRQLPVFMFAFLGALLVIKPGLRLDMFPAFIALFAAICMSISFVSLRYLRLTDHYLVIVNYFTYISGLASLIILLIQKSFELPNLSDFIILILLGVIGLLAQIALTKAYQLAPANLVSIYIYSQIIFASALGFLFFKEIPDIFSISGASFIIISGYLNYKFKSNN